MATITSRPPPAVSPSVTSASVSASSATTIPTSEESMQSDNSPTFQFTNAQDLFDKIDHTSGDSLTVTNVSPGHFTEIQREREEQGGKFRFRDYDSNSRVLSITIPTHLHEQLHNQLYIEFAGQIRDMGLKKSWINIGSAIHSAQQGQIGKEGDSAGGPKPERAATGAWPTLVIEAGFSQTSGRLRLTMRRWFSMSNHEVKIVLLAKFDGTTILLEKWEEEVPVRPGAATTRRSLQHQTPVLRQSITITQNATTNPISYNVTRGALVLSFRLLFLRDPGPGEGDLVFSVQELEEYAETVWLYV